MQVNNIGTKVLTTFIKSQENLSSTRFIQDTATNWAPKAVFSRSKADFCEMSFLEFLESGIFYFAPPLIGEKLYRNKIFKAIQKPELKEKVNEFVPKSIDVIKKSPITDAIKKQSIATKAGIALACACIPIAEYNLSFAKNLFTLKTFKKSNFENIAALGQEGEDKKQQERVEKHSKKQLKKAAIYSSLALLGGIALAKFGAKSDKLQKFSETLLEPGKQISKAFQLENKTSKASKSADKFLKEYLKLDFNEDKGKLALSKGQLALTAISGLFGYSKAAEDRGELDKKEVWTRVPLVVFYTIFGSSLFDAGFKKILAQKGKYPDLIKKGADGIINEIPKSTQLQDIAKNVSKTSGKTVEEEFKRLTKEKAIITGVPYLFSLLFMGFSLSLITRLLTKKRYEKEHQNQEDTFQKNHENFINKIDSQTFGAFVKK